MRRLIAIIALAALAACNQQEAKGPAEPEAPPSLRSQVRRLPMEQRPVFAVEQLSLALQAQGESCTVRRAEPRGTVPDNVDPESIYGPFVGADVFTVQCGERLTTVRDDPRQHWLVVLPAEGEAQIVNCADERGRDRCAVRQIPTLEASAP